MNKQRIKIYEPWRLPAYLTALMVLVPLGVIVGSLFSPEKKIITHLYNTLMGELIVNTALLALGVAAGTAFLGTVLGWLIATHRFPGRDFLSWALLLPLAIPTYVLAFIFIELFDYTGPVQSYLRLAWGQPLQLPDIRSTAGVILVISLALYPYVYLLAKNAFSSQGRRISEAALTMGYDGFSGFYQVALPAASPWIGSGVLLVVMETVADFGAVSIFNYNTFTTAIYKSWYGFFSLTAALQLAAVLLLFVFGLIALHEGRPKKSSFVTVGRNSGQVVRRQLRGLPGIGATLFCWSVFLLAFLLPTSRLVIWSSEVFAEHLSYDYIGYIQNSLTLALVTAASTLVVALLISYGKRHLGDKLTAVTTMIATLGYALPGTILAVGVFYPIAAVDNFLIATADLFGIELGPILNGALVTTAFVCLLRFMAVAFSTIDSALKRVTISIDQAAALLGSSSWATLRHIHLPLLKNGALTAFILVFVDAMKEMPITLMTRPFGFDTLAVKIFELTSEGEWERAALPALVLVIIGMIPVFLLTRYGEEA